MEKLAPLEARQIFVVDCFSIDGSDKIAAAMGATVVQHEWPGLYAKQFNWALDNLPIKTSWVLRLDADEYLYPDAIEEVKNLLPKWDGKMVTDGGLPPDATSLSLARASVLRPQDKIWRNGAHPDGAVLQAWHRPLPRSCDG